MTLLAANTALNIAQQTAIALAEWVGADSLVQKPHPPDTEAIAHAKKLLSWGDSANFQPLKVIFDQIKLTEGSTQQHYWEAKILEDKNPLIPYPQNQPPTEEELTSYKSKLKETLQNLSDSDWQNLSLLSLIIEKYGSFLSLGQDNIALVDLMRSTAAVAAALTENPQAKELSLIAGNLSGIQNFIYTISSDGALKSLRARSFYLELVTEEVVQQLLIALKLPRTNVIYAGGGNLYILAPSQENQATITEITNNLNEWLLKKFQGKVSLAINSHNFNTQNIASKAFAQDWTKVTKSLAIQKSQKFKSQINKLLQPQDSYEPCKVCHRDDVKILKPLNPQEANSVTACGTCRRMYRLGGQLFNLQAIVRSTKDSLAGALDSLEVNGVYYHLFSNWSETKNITDHEVLYLVNDWTISHYANNNTVPLLLGNYGQKSQLPDEKTFMSASEMTTKAKGIKRVGYLRMDVDRLGQIFAKGLGEQQTLPRLAGLSRQMSYYFKVYLNSLAQSRYANFLNKLSQVKNLSKSDRPNLLFIYAGGDDLFVSGAWNETVEFAFDIYQSFRAYTGNNPDITLSAGVSLADSKFPLYQAAEESGEAEGKAKNNGRDSLGLFGQVFKWNEWLGKPIITPETTTYLNSQSQPSLLGILPFVEHLDQIDVNYSRGFVRNLLTTAELQESQIKQAKEKRARENEIQDIRYFLHLPKIAYTLARLPKEVVEKESFKPVKTGLKSPYNAPYFRAIATWLELLNRSE